MPINFLDIQFNEPPSNARRAYLPTVPAVKTGRPLCGDNHFAVSESECKDSAKLLIIAIVQLFFAPEGDEGDFGWGADAGGDDDTADAVGDVESLTALLVEATPTLVEELGRRYAK